MEDFNMNYTIIYSSNTGNTKMLAQTIADELNQTLTNQDKLTVTDINDAEINPVCTPDNTIYFVGFWTDKGTCPQSIASLLQSLKGCRIFLFGTAGFGESQAYFDKLLANVCQYVPDTGTVIGTFMCQGKMPQSVRSRYEKMLADKPEDASIQNLIRNFDKALSHPDDTDKNNLIAAIRHSLS